MAPEPLSRSEKLLHDQESIRHIYALQTIAGALEKLQKWRNKAQASMKKRKGGGNEVSSAQRRMVPERGQNPPARAHACDARAH